jgi:hypothetical protein
MEEYLAASGCCDIEHPEIIRQSRALVEGKLSEREKAAAIFRFVRNQVKYRFDYPARKASETLSARQGNCFNKANLQAALLRAAGLEAGYGVLLTNRDIFEPLLPPDIFELVTQPTVHVYGCCRFDGTWRAADATLDPDVFEAVYRGKPGWSWCDWDGRADCRMDPKHVIEDQGVYANIDLYLQIPPRFWNDQLLARANNYVLLVLQKTRKE